MEKIKLIWDFRGADAAELARHHAKHLGQFAEREQLESSESGVEAVSDKHHMAWIIVPEEHMIAVRNALRPHRGQRVKVGGH